MTVPNSMRAAVYTRYGAPNVVSVQHVPTPKLGANDLLVRVRATTVSTADWRLRSFTMPRGFGVLGRLALGITAPRTHILGGEFSGDVVAIGAAVTNFAVGDAVIACTGSKLGAHAEYCRIAANGVVVPKPPQLGFDVAAAIAFGGMT
ncbi:MAG: alcohol dehydrogenase catalytic domain-containing protein, partial [Gemmatimonadaceae bacterium]|nr:alcohol dehydrogenase catalytic domain-containing protein [Gemmatimonadaceae bacterium]